MVKQCHIVEVRKRKRTRKIHPGKTTPNHGGTLGENTHEGEMINISKLQVNFIHESYRKT
jgi:hypothetical protein